jgi:hypothetical protein
VILRQCKISLFVNNAQTKEDYQRRPQKVNNPMHPTNHCRRNIIIGVSIGFVLLAVALLIFFYFPRVPKIEVQKDVQINSFSVGVSPPQLVLNFTVNNFPQKFWITLPAPHKCFQC